MGLVSLKLLWKQLESQVTTLTFCSQMTVTPLSQQKAQGALFTHNPKRRGGGGSERSSLIIKRSIVILEMGKFAKCYMDDFHYGG